MKITPCLLIRTKKKQIAELQAKAQETRGAEVAEAKAKIKAIMIEYGLTIADIGETTKPILKAQRTSVPIKYRDDVTGDTWTGRGRAPKWIEGKDKNQYLVKA